MEKAYYIVTEELIISLLVGKIVRFFHKDYGIKNAILVSIIDGKNRIYSFRNNEHPLENTYIIENCNIMYLDYDWESIGDNINNVSKIQLKESK